MILTSEQLDEVLGIDLAYNPFFSEGTAIMIDGTAWRLTDIVGDVYCFSSCSDIEESKTNMDYFFNIKA